MRGTLYTSWKDALGTSHTDEPVAVFENGKIYTAVDGFLGTTSKGVLVGEYENGIVYTVGTGAVNYGKRLDAVAVIEEGKIYSISKSMFGGISKSLSVGECSYGKVYSHSHKIMEGSDTIGLYNGDVEGAAATAAIALFGLNSGVSAYDSSLKDDTSHKHIFERASEHSEGDSGSGAGCLFTAIVGAIIFAVSILAIIFSAIAFIPTVLIYLLVKFIVKRTRKETDESDEQKRKEFIVVLLVSMIIAVGLTIAVGVDSNDMLLPCIGSGIIEIIGFVWIINSIKNGKEIKFLKKFKKIKKGSTYESDTYEKKRGAKEEKKSEPVVKTASIVDKKAKEDTEIDDSPADAFDILKKYAETVDTIPADVMGDAVSEKNRHNSEKNTGSSGRLKSTMRTRNTDDTEGSDKLTPAGDL